MPIDAGTIFSEVRITLDKLKGDIKKVETALDKFGNKNKREAKKNKNEWEKSFKGIGLAGVAAFAALAFAVKKAIGIFADFEQSLANVQSVARATPEEFEKIKQAALEAGETTRFTATQAAEALYFLASAGLSATESISALQGVLQLAGATGSDLAQTSAIMTATLAQFSLESEESIRVSNVFAAAIANSQATMEKLGGAMRQVGPISGALGISLEETTASLQALFNAGFAGEQAGTALRNILLELSDSTGPVVKKLEKLGIAFEDISIKEVGLTGAVDTLSKSGIDLGNIFGKRVAAQILTLANVGGDALRELEEDITGTNAAAEAYAIQNDTLAGSIDFLNSAFQTSIIQIGEEFAPILKGLVDILTDIVKGYNSLPGPVKLITGLLATALPIFIGLSTVISKLGGIIGALGGPIGFAITGFTLLLGAAKALDETFGKTKLATIIPGTLERAVEQGKDLNEQIELIAKNTGLSVEEVEALASENEKVRIALEEQKKLEDELLSLEKKRLAEVEKLAAFGALQSLLQKDIAGLIKSQIDEINKALDEGTKETQGDVENTVKQTLGNITAAFEAGAISQEEAIKRLLELRKSMLKELQDEATLSGEISDANLKAIREQEVAIGQLTSQLDILDAAKEADLKLSEEQVKADEDLVALKKQFEDQLQKIGKTEGELIELSRKSAIESIKESNATIEAKEEAIKAVNDYHDALQDDRAAKVFKKRMEDLKEDVKGFYGELLSSLSTLFSAITDERLANLDRQLQAELEAAGLSEQTEREKLQAQLKEFIDTGDQENAEKTRQDIQRLKIEERYEKERAKIKYRGELQQYRITLAQSIASAASAILSGYATKPFLPVGLLAGILATTLSAIQLAAVRKSKPTPPSFQRGGIVLPSGSSSGTLVNTAEKDSAELLLNNSNAGRGFLREFAQEIAGFINGNNQQGGNITVHINMDGKKLAEANAKYYNDGIVRLNA